MQKPTMKIHPAAALLAAQAALLLCTGSAQAASSGAALEDYKPLQQVSGTLRSRGDDQMGALLKRWQKGFQRYQPNIHFEDTLKGTDSAIYGLEMRTADIAVMGRPINPFERYGTYERSWTFPVEIEVATGSFSQPAKAGAYAILVGRDNPLSKLTLKQLDGIFGAERLGGWKALSWDEASARPAGDNLRTWGQLGLTGAWADKPIHVYGPPLLGAGSVTFFQSRVLAGGAMWNEDLREYADRTELMAALAKDPYGIAYAELPGAAAGLKTVALAETAAGPYVPFTKAGVADRSYALARPVYLDYTIDNAKSELADPRVDPKVHEFLRYVLSKQGQQEVQREGAYLPLTASVVARQLKILESKETPPEQLLLDN
jgi:phosphate transport system substrate-binding protein